MASSMKWDEIKRSIKRSVKTNWNLFKQSKLGLVGLGIITFFVILAVFAPIIPYTYSVDYLAPAGDLFEIDNYTAPIPSHHQWAPPVSILTPQQMGKPTRVAGIWLYSQDGTGYFYPRNFSYSQLYRLKTPVEKTVPKNMTHMEYLLNNKKLVGFDKDTFYIYSVNFMPNEMDVDVNSFMENPEKVHFAHPMSYVSNIWDYNITDRTSGTVDSVIAMATGDNKTVSVMIWVYGKVKDPITFMTIHYHGVYIYNFTVNSTIIANPSVDFNYRNGQHWVIVPTEDYIYRYDVNLAYNGTYGYIDGISGVRKVWEYSMTHNGEKYVPVSPSSVSLVYPKSDQAAVGKDILVALCKDNQMFGLYTKNGTEIWNTTVAINPQDARIHYVDFTSLYPSVRDYVILAGKSNLGSVVAEFDPRLGEIMNNKTSYLTLRGDVNYVSRYDLGSHTYYVSTTEGYIYQLNESFYTDITQGYKVVGLAKSFSVLGGVATPVVFLGNTIINTNLVGAYMGVVTKQDTLYLQASGGTRIPTIVIPPFSYGRQSHNFYLLGSDYEGHDVWTWLVYGSRTSLLVGLTAAVISVLVGTFIGIISGFYGGWIDTLVMRIVDIILTLPSLVIMLLMASVLGPNIWNIVLIIAVLGWAGIARVIRAVTLSLKNRPFMDAARIAGASNARMITVHIFPNVLPLTFLYMTFGVSGAILSEAALAFLGLGDPNSVSWGMMLQYLRMYGQQTNPNAWAWLIMPGVFITLISLAFYLVGRAFDEIVNPRLRKR
ncbi:MAG: ABC transporter permease subunit [Euryarchaeota archaeon]|nr:ABC transporter permease subunit [Euryarchaeota archaeon]